MSKILVIWCIIIVSFMVKKGECTMIQANDNNFLGYVQNNTRYVLVDFSAQWCGPCKMLAPVIANIAKDLENQVDVIILDVDECQNICTKFGIRSVPTLMVFAPGGHLIAQRQGGGSGEQILAWLLANIEQHQKNI